MSALLKAREPSAKYIVTPEAPLVRHFELLATAPGGVARLRQLILTLAIQGKLVPQEPSDEPAEVLLRRSRALVRDQMRIGTTKREKPAEEVQPHEMQFSLPSGWHWCRLVDTGAYINGLAFKASDFQNHGIPVIRIQNLSGRSGEFNRTTGEFDRSVLVSAGDILVSWSATLDAFVWTGERGVLNQHIFRVEPAPAVRKQYVFWLLKWAIRDLADSDHAHGLVMPHINRGPFLAKPIALPPLAEQARIVTRVKELMRLCDALEAKGRLEAAQHSQLVTTLLGTLTDSESSEALADRWQRIAAHFDILLDRPEAVDTLEQTIVQLAVRGLLVPQELTDEPAIALLRRMRSEKDKLIAEGKVKREKPASIRGEESRPFKVKVGWEWTQLIEIATSGPTNGLSPRPSELPTAFRCLTLSATTRGYFKGDCFKYVDISTVSAQPCYLKQGDLLIQRGNSLDYVGIAALYDGADDEFIYPDLMMRLRLSQHVVPEYVHAYLISSEGRAYFKRNATGTQGTMPKVNQATVAHTPIPLPPLAEQFRIVARVKELRRLCTDLRHRLAAAQATQAQLAEALVAQPAP